MKNRIAFIAALLGVAVAMILNPQTAKAWSGDPQGAGDTQSPLNDVVGYNGYGVNYTSYTLRTTSGGTVMPGDQNETSDLGSPLHRWRNFYMGGMLVTDPETPRSLSTIGVAVASAGIPIVPSSTFMEFTSTGGPIKMTATPTISTAAFRPGTVLWIISSTTSIMLQDKNTLAGSGLTLATATLMLCPGDSAWFVLGSSQNTWNQMGWIDVLNP